MLAEVKFISIIVNVIVFEKWALKAEGGLAMIRKVGLFLILAGVLMQANRVCTAQEHAVKTLRGVSVNYCP